MKRNDKFAVKRFICGYLLPGYVCVLACVPPGRARELMTEHYPNSAMYRWQRKPVPRRLVLDDTEGPSTICKKVNLAALSLSSEEAHGGAKSLLMKLPIRKKVEGGDYRNGRANYGFAGISINDPELPWSPRRSIR